MAAPVVSTGGSDIGRVRGGDGPDANEVPAGQTITDVDLTGVLKSYSPPRFVRSIRQVETGKHMNERILGRLQPEETNFSVVLASDFEALYAYNQDYQFEIVEELHSNASGAGIRYVIDLATGTLFDREWSAYTQNDQDRDITLRFILKAYTRTFMDITRVNNRDVRSHVIPVISMAAGTGTSSATFMTRGHNPDSFEIEALVSMFAPNRGVMRAPAPTEPESPFTMR